MRKQKILLVLFIAMIFFSCKKYEEGLWFSFRGVDKRIEGFWELEYLFINDVDSTAAVKSQDCNGLLFLSIPYDLKHEGDWSLAPVNGTCKQCKGEWGISKDKKFLGIEHRSNDTCEFKSVGPYLASNSIEIKWQIIKLTVKQLWLETEYNGQNCWAHFKKVDYP